jgi:hypothetical protein
MCCTLIAVICIFFSVCLVMASELNETCTQHILQYKYCLRIIVVDGLFIRLFSYVLQQEVLPKHMGHRSVHHLYISMRLLHTWSEWGQMASTYESSNELSGSSKCEKFLEWMWNFCLLKKASSPLSCYDTRHKKDIQWLLSNLSVIELPVIRVIIAVSSKFHLVDRCVCAVVIV